MKSKRFALYNATDAVYAAPQAFDTEREAWAYAQAFRGRFKQQGYYKTAEGWRIDPDEIELEVIPVE